MCQVVNISRYLDHYAEHLYFWVVRIKKTQRGKQREVRAQGYINVWWCGYYCRYEYTFFFWLYLLGYQSSTQVAIQPGQYLRS